MKRSTVVRWMCAIALILCFGIWSNHYLSVTHTKAWEWNSWRLNTIVGFMSDEPIMQFDPIARNMGIAAILCGTIPLIPGFFGLIRPKSEALLLVSIVSTVVLVFATFSVYFLALSLYGTIASATVMPELGTYIAGIVAAIELWAGIVARKISTPLADSVAGA